MQVTEMWRLVPEWVEGIPAWIYWSLGILILISILVAVALRKTKKARSRETWLHQHYTSLPKKAKKKLIKLRNERRGKPRYPRKWQEISARIRRERPACEVCGSKTKHVHHRRYRRFGSNKPGDLIAVCEMCHYFIHPHGNMTREAFKQLGL